ncbi:hypothetical protein, partial [Mangrovicoccus algicola]
PVARAGAIDAVLLGAAARAAAAAAGGAAALPGMLERMAPAPWTLPPDPDAQAAMAEDFAILAAHLGPAAQPA